MPRSIAESKERQRKASRAQMNGKLNLLPNQTEAKMLSDDKGSFFLLHRHSDGQWQIDKHFHLTELRARFWIWMNSNWIETWNEMVSMLSNEHVQMDFRRMNEIKKCSKLLRLLAILVERNVSECDWRSLHESERSRAAYWLLLPRSVPNIVFGEGKMILREKVSAHWQHSTACGASSHWIRTKRRRASVRVLATIEMDASSTPANHKNTDQWSLMKMN